ncbi:MAG: tetratricopeptide repeat protein [Calditrichaceae bacterium]
MKYLKMASILALTLIFATGCIFGKKKGIESEQITAEELLQAGNEQFNAGKYNEAINTYESLLLKFPTSDLHIETQLRMADSYGAMDKYEEQMDLLLRLLKENIIPDRVPRIYTQIGRFYERAALFNPGIVTSDSSDYQLAIRYYEKAVKYPDSDDQFSKSEAQYRKALVKAKTGRTDDAVIEYKKVPVLFPESMYSILARIKLVNPEDSKELPTDATSLKNYKEQLGITSETSAKPVSSGSDEVVPLEKATSSDLKQIVPEERKTDEESSKTDVSPEIEPEEDMQTDDIQEEEMSPSESDTTQAVQ